MKTIYTLNINVNTYKYKNHQRKSTDEEHYFHLKRLPCSLFSTSSSFYIQLFIRSAAFSKFKGTARYLLKEEYKYVTDENVLDK